MPMPGGTAGMRQDRRDQPLGVFAMVGAGRFDQGDGARQCPPVAGAQGGGQVVRHSAIAASRRAASCWRAHIVA